MKSDTTHSTFAQPEAETAVYLFDDWFDPIETCVRDRVREFIQAMIEGELDATLLRPRYGRLAKHAAADKVVPSAVGHRHGRRSRSLTGTFGRVEIEVPRARLEGANGKTTEWQSKVLRAYQRRTLAADALIASTYLSGTNTRRVRRALKALFGGAVSKDTVSRIWRKVKADWESWNARSLADEPIVRLILDGTVVRGQHAVNTAAALFRRSDRRRRSSGRPFVCDDLLEALDTVLGEGRDAILADAVDAQAAVFGEHVDREFV